MSTVDLDQTLHALYYETVQYEGGLIRDFLERVHAVRDMIEAVDTDIEAVDHFRVRIRPEYARVADSIRESMIEVGSHGGSTIDFQAYCESVVRTIEMRYLLLEEADRFDVIAAEYEFRSRRWEREEKVLRIQAATTTKKAEKMRAQAIGAREDAVCKREEADMGLGLDYELGAPVPGYGPSEAGPSYHPYDFSYYAENVYPDIGLPETLPTYYGWLNE